MTPFQAMRLAKSTGGGGGGGDIAFDPLYTHAHVTLTNSDRTAERTTSTDAGGNTRATVSRATGKWYTEILVVDTGAPGSNCALGLCTSSFDPLTASYLGEGTSAWAYWADGQRYYNAVNTAGYSGYTDGDVLGIAWDADAGLIWWAKNNTWELSSSPVTGAKSGYGSVTGTCYPVFEAYKPNSKGTIRALAGYSYSPPAGFGAWEGSAAAPVAADLALDPLATAAVVTLSGSDRIATRTTSSGNGGGSVGNSYKNTGKWYVEFVAITNTSGQLAFGIVNRTYDPAGAYFLGGSASGGWGYWSDGTRYFNNSTTSGHSSFTDGDVIGMAWDADAGKVWWSKNNAWQSSGDPAAGTNESYASVTGPCWPVIDCYGATRSGAIRKESENSYSPPSGFSAWHR